MSLRNYVTQVPMFHLHLKNEWFRLVGIYEHDIRAFQLLIAKGELTPDEVNITRTNWDGEDYLETQDRIIFEDDGSISSDVPELSIITNLKCELMRHKHGQV